MTDGDLATIIDIYKKGVFQNKLKQIQFVSLRNFQSNSTVHFEFPITVLVGKNGSGKSTILKAIRSIETGRHPKDEFFETKLDDSGVSGAIIKYQIQDSEFTYSRVKENTWKLEGERVGISLRYIDTSSLLGAMQKGLFYSDVGKHEKHQDKVDRIIKETRKLVQNNLEKSTKKIEWQLDKDAVHALSYILEKDYSSVKFIKHRYYSGTWSEAVIFSCENQYSEYNAGNGEFHLAHIAEKFCRAPERGIILLDEPEISLHPGAQKRLMNFIFKMVKEKKIQVIISTHSPYIVANLPNIAIVCLRKVGSKVAIEEMNYPEEAFLELETPPQNRKRIIVEDNMAKAIIDAVLKNEKWNDLVDVCYRPGGADHIKKTIVFSFAKMGVRDSFFLFDGDQQLEDVPDLSEVPEKEKTDQYFKEIFPKSVGIKSSTIEWGVDANRECGRHNKMQERELIEQYLTFWKRNVYFLPGQIPEDLIYDETAIKALLREDELAGIVPLMDSKEKLFEIADKFDVSQQFLQEGLIRNFVKSKNENYQKIVDVLKGVLEAS